jgi:hypothetical protein
MLRRPSVDDLRQLRQPDPGRGGLVVDDVVDGRAVVAEGQHGRGGGVVQVDVRPDAAAVADDGELAGAHEGGPAVARVAVEVAVPQRDPACGGDRLVEVGQRGEGLARRGRGCRVERVVLGLDRPALAGIAVAGIALGDDLAAAHARGAGGGQQDVGAFGPGPGRRPCRGGCGGEGARGRWRARGRMLLWHGRWPGGGGWRGACRRDRLSCGVVWEGGGAVGYRRADRGCARRTRRRACASRRAWYRQDGVAGLCRLGCGPARAGGTAVRVIRGACAESEAGLAFAGLHLLLGPALGRVAALPPRQQKALRGAFGLGPASAAGRFLVGLGVLSLLTELAGDGPLLCLVDDAHWLDRASADALVFASRRLHAVGIAVVFTARDHGAGFPAASLPELRLAGLDAAAASSLLMEHGGTALPPQVRRLILAEASGNPLGLIELSAACLGSGATVPGAGRCALRLPGRLQRAFGDPVRQLPGPTQALLLAAAAEGSGDLPVVLAAGGALAATAADLAPAEQAHLVRVQDGTVRFCHPLVRRGV